MSITAPPTPQSTWTKEDAKASRKANRKLHRKEYIWAGAFMAAPVIGWLAFLLFPLAFSVYASLTNWNGLGNMVFIGLDNYVMLFQDPYFWRALWNTVFYMIGIPIGLALSLGLAMALSRRIPGRTFFRTVYYIPVISSLAAIAILWQWAYNGDFGLVNQFLSIFGIEGPNWLMDENWAKPALIIMAIWKGLGYSTILYLAAVQAVPRSLYEAAALDGAGGWRRFRTITLPMVRPVTFFLVVTNIIGGSMIFTEINIMTPTGGPNWSTASLVWYIWNKAFKNLQMGYATSMALVLGILVLIVTVIQFRMNKRNDFSIE
ncbi:carbohydrate ABC transporter permease [Demequina sp. NBRC 110057]|uniref:carbohydrate ABC transporter permease n=1 Tax=Demequina sp. NBRC 110057 TaxID=1570346 RepID=UPI000A00CD36|nr:sugar ABC transporter permease [Demequina sp. NBRC 110057]